MVFKHINMHWLALTDDCSRRPVEHPPRLSPESSASARMKQRALAWGRSPGGFPSHSSLSFAACWVAPMASQAQCSQRGVSPAARHSRNEGRQRALCHGLVLCHFLLHQGELCRGVGRFKHGWWHVSSSTWLEVYAGAPIKTRWPQLRNLPVVHFQSPQLCEAPCASRVGAVESGVINIRDIRQRIWACP